MYFILLKTHSGLRYLVFLMLVIVIINSLMGVVGKKPFGKSDNLLSLILLISTHLQFLAGLILYFVSPRVNLGDMKQSDDTFYWTVEHAGAMLVAVALITVARSISKKLPDPAAKHMRLLLLNTIAVVIIVVTILHGGRKLFGS